MPKKITSVNWTASGIPSGLSFNEETGTFTGTAGEAGEYTVPVTVRTNYGTDTKDVTVTVEGRAYPVYAVGSQAAEWSENAEADANGFRGLNMPDATKLLQHPSGFGAKTAMGKYYCCGVDKIVASNAGSIANVLHTVNTPTELATIDGYNVDEVKLLYLYRKSYTSAEETTNECYLLSKIYNRTQLDLSISKRRHYYYSSASGGLTNTAWAAFSLHGTPSTDIAYKLPDGFLPRTEWCDGLYLLENDGSTYTQISASNNTSGTPTLNCNSGNSIGYKAIKVFGSSYRDVYGTALYTNPLYKYLSADKLLNNDANNFTLGTIKDAWVYATKCYVYTEDGKVYEKSGKSGEWTDCGSYDVKKLIMYTASNIFVLTQDGKIYHKGTAISNVTEAHEGFTQIFPEYYFYDMAIDSSTLTVLKEDR